jgi:iron complex outermembrane receptor protein
MHRKPSEHGEESMRTLFSATRRVALALGAAAGAISAGPSAFAQGAAAQPVAAAGIDEIVVTATRREENLQEVPIAVSVFSATDIAELGAPALNEVMDFAPNVARTTGPSSGNEAYYFIRGVGQQDNSVSLDPGVGVYVDGVYIGRLQGASVDLSDARRVEVLRGPQGTLFGRNTIGGAVNITTQDPDPVLGGQATATVGARELAAGRASVSLPLSDTFGVRVTANTRTQEGLGKNARTGFTYGDVDTISGRIKAVWRPDDSFRLDVIADAATFAGSPAHLRLREWSTNNLAGPFRGASALAVPFPTDIGADRSNDPYANFNSVAPINDSESRGLAAIAAFDWEGGSLKSITSGRSFSQEQWTDLDATLYTFYDFFNKTDQTQFSQELQLSGETENGRLNWLGGLYYLRESIDNAVDICVGTGTVTSVTRRPPTAPVGPLFANPGPATRLDGRCLSVINAFNLDIDSRAVFGQLGYRLTDRLELVLGARWTTEQKDQRFNNFADNRDRVGSNAPLAPQGPIAQPGTVNPTLSPLNPILPIPTAYSNTWEDFSPKLGVNFEVTEDVLLYGSYAEGFKSGGFNGRVQSTATAVVPFEQEEVKSYELGFKSTLFDRRLRLNGALFRSEYQDIQLLLVIPANGLFETGNGGDAEIDGAELDAVFAPHRDWTFNLAVGWLDARYTRISPRAPQETAANGGYGLSLRDRLPLTPEWTLAGGARYRLDLGEASGVTLRADYTYRSDVTFQVYDNAGDNGPAYGLLNLRAAYAPKNERFTVAVFGTNVLDETYIRTAQDNRLQLGNFYDSPGAPAEWGLELSLRY